jgi:hypothetical protein
MNKLRILAAFGFLAIVVCLIAYIFIRKKNSTESIEAEEMLVSSEDPIQSIEEIVDVVKYEENEAVKLYNGMITTLVFLIVFAVILSIIGIFTGFFGMIVSSVLFIAITTPALIKYSKRRKLVSVSSHQVGQ